MPRITTLEAGDIREAIGRAERRTGLRFAVFLGGAREGRRRYAERLHAALGEDAGRAVLIYVDLAGRALEIVTGEHARRDLPDGRCRLVATAMATRLAAGDLAGGVVYGVNALAEQAVRRA
ncbi:putative membrane protein YgcG [Thermocatellispora tengchongensis]|uniref:Putative membrane protein YgcG n=1 Tax=Thermocatellispora tengchongensis TaxID=1073253 RepID=A0A840P4U6_9ACTN|nr:TPM domain-containing protein [Thermocatellispora tengchongensis]MBB5136324.1 putative membrane protein YgcG [Thermocatellispora tengchongensis]